jgi:hypothetical protein
MARQFAEPIGSTLLSMSNCLPSCRHLAHWLSQPAIQQASQASQLLFDADGAAADDDDDHADGVTT